MDRKPVIHELKTWAVFFNAVFMQHKNFELRKNDRNFNVGDFLYLKEFDPEKQEYTGRELSRRVTYILRGTPETEAFGIKVGYCIMSIS